MKKVEFNHETGHPNVIAETLNRKVGQYLSSSMAVTIGITGRDPHERFREHLQKDSKWRRMVIIYSTTSEKNANEIERRLVKKFWNKIQNMRRGGGSSLSFCGDNYVYILIR